MSLNANSALFIIHVKLRANLHKNNILFLIKHRIQQKIHIQNVKVHSFPSNDEHITSFSSSPMQRETTTKTIHFHDLHLTVWDLRSFHTILVTSNGSLVLDGARFTKLLSESTQKMNGSLTDSVNLHCPKDWPQFIFHFIKSVRFDVVQ